MVQAPGEEGRDSRNEGEAVDIARRPRPALSGWERAVVLLALVRVALGTLGGVVSPGGQLVWLSEVVAFGGVGAFLLRASRASRASSAGETSSGRAEYETPAAHLAGFLAVVGSTYASGLIRGLFAVLPFRIAWLEQLVSGLHPDAFLAYFLWAFVASFPPSSRQPSRLGRAVPRLAAGVGGLLFLATFLVEGAPSPFARRAWPGLLEALSRDADSQIFWKLVMSLATLAIPFAFWKVRLTPEPERRRLTAFTVALTLGYGPVFVDTLALLWVPGYEPRQPEWMRSLVLVFLLTTPLTTAYAVLVHRVLDVGTVVRRALRYALARGTVIVAAVVPFVALVAYLYEHRRMPLSDLLSGTRPLVLLGALTAGGVLVGVRRRLLEAIDRRFFREHYDAGLTLSSLVERGRQASSVDELSELLEREVDRALHLSMAAFLVARPSSGTFTSRDGRLPPLEAASSLLALLQGSAQPLDVDLEGRRTPVAGLPVEDRGWLEATAARLLVPFVGSDGSVLGLLALGAKRSELAFSREDRSLLSAIAASGAVALENRLMRDSSSGGLSRKAHGIGVDDGPPEESVGLECARCGVVYAPATASCDCGKTLGPARVPFLLLGKFRVDRRVGAGGMGVVYRGRDLALGRTVALKTLPRVSAEYALRLRREARAAASLSHPSIAVIYGAETWHGTPILVFEYLGGGTLAELLLKGPLDAGRAVGLGLVLADALAAAHGRNVLHRDLKPSNIGFTEGGQPKLLDFGLARILHDGRRESAFQESTPDASRAQTSPLTLQTVTATGVDGYVVGTPAYMSPEAVAGHRPDESVDLWGAAVVLYEAVTGRNPFLRPSLGETLSAVRHDVAPDARELVPEIPKDLAALLVDALARERSRRPATAAELRARLAALA